MISDPLNIILLDTDVFSYLMEPGDPRGQPYLRHVEGRTTALSFITVGELLFGAFWRGWGERRPVELRRRLEAAFILPLDHETSLAYGRLKSGLRRQGRVLADNDLWGNRGQKRLPDCYLVGGEVTGRPSVFGHKTTETFRLCPVFPTSGTIFLPCACGGPRSSPAEICAGVLIQPKMESPRCSLRCGKAADRNPGGLVGPSLAAVVK